MKQLTAKTWGFIAVGGAVLFVAGLLLGWLVFPYVVAKTIGKQLALQDKSDAYDRFVELPLDLDMKLSIFNVTNVDEIMRGGKPRLQELGPYVYKQHRTKYNLKYDADDDTWSYHQNLIHTFDPQQSGKFTENDVVTVINPALMSMLGIMQNIPVLAKGTMFVDAAAPLLFKEGLFVTTTADKLLFRGVRIECGWLEKLGRGDQKVDAVSAAKAGLAPSPRLAALITCSSLKRIKVPTLKVLDDGDVLFYVFGQKNNTFDGRYTVNAGIRHPERLGQITAWEGKSSVSAWGGPTCNAINGTQGDLFTPDITRQSEITVFSTDICRSMTLQYLEDTSFKGISGYRFAPGPEVMASPVENGNNYCFCPQVASGLTKENGCLRKGAMDLSGCQGIPVIVTYPHFYEADPFYLEGVVGLNPQADLHRMQLDVEPMTGVPLMGGKKMQLNFEVKHIPGVELTRGVRDVLFPVAWMYEGAELNTEMLNLLNGLLFNNLKILDAIKYTMLVLGVLMFAVGLFMCLRIRRRRHVEPSDAANEAARPRPRGKRPAE